MDKDSCKNCEYYINPPGCIIFEDAVIEAAIVGRQLDKGDFLCPLYHRFEKYSEWNSPRLNEDFTCGGLLGD